jgi:hypothetical protein
MLAGEFKGMPVKDAKPLVLQKMLDTGLALKVSKWCFVFSSSLWLWLWLVLKVLF